MLTFGHSGVRSLESILATRPSLACTSGTGILPLCAQATATWQRLEQNPTRMSAMAASSIRALASTMIACTLAAVGGSRWCEVTTAPASADPFARLFPNTQFICFHRACDQVISDITQASRWGLDSVGIADFAAMYPGNSVAAVAAYWLANTNALLDFETAHPGQSLRVRHEDLTVSTTTTASSILQFLGLNEHQPAPPDLPVQARDIAMAAGLPGTGTDQEIPVEFLPSPMLDRINSLQARLGYPPLGREQETQARRAR